MEASPLPSAPAPLRQLSLADAEEYFRGIHPLWGGGLEREQFVAYQRRLMNAPESTGRYQLLGLFDGLRVLSAMKVYRLAGAQQNQPLEIRGVGAVFTAPSLRRRGYAGHMMRMALQSFISEGASAAILFSDIGTDYYEKLGFRTLESAECTLDASMLPRGKVGARPAGPGDEPQMIRAFSRHRANQGVTLSREDGWSLKFQLRRLRELARARNVGEPDWGLIVDGPGREASAAAMIRYTKDGIDILEMAWDTDKARDAIFGALRERLIRATRSTVRVWPVRQLRGLFPSGPRKTATAMLAPLAESTRSIEPLSRAELSLLDHI